MVKLNLLGGARDKRHHHHHNLKATVAPILLAILRLLFVRMAALRR